MDLDANGVFDLRDIVVLATSIIAIIGAIVVLRKHIAKPFVKWFRTQLVDFFHETIQSDIETIKHEVTANDGSSLKDLVKKNHDETLHLLDERDKAFARIAAPADQRLRAVENAVSLVPQIMERLDELSRQGASDTSKVIRKIDNPTQETP